MTDEQKNALIAILGVLVVAAVVAEKPKQTKVVRPKPKEPKYDLLDHISGYSLVDTLVDKI